MSALSAVDLRRVHSDASGARRAVLDGLSISAETAKTLVVLGPSGAGKSTLLRVIAGLEPSASGSVRVGERDVTSLPPHKRRIALVFQDDGLFPHLNLRDNLAFGLRLRGLPATQIHARVRAIAIVLGIDAYLHRFPARVSGGERQRAALARALLSDPDVLLLDEPLAHLDPQLRTSVRQHFAMLRYDFSGPVVYVTHDHLEALAMADTLAVLMDGKIVQCDTPDRVYEYPRNVRVARFFGTPQMNLLEDEVAKLGIRPEHVRIEPTGPLEGTLAGRSRVGPDWYVNVKTSRGDLLARVPQEFSIPSDGTRLRFSLPEWHVRRFDRVTGEARP
ncbi:MAG: ABC transporter ATP-binding protein [Candidatus Eremiobacteraeota bacterium]|nr:ABC transporter ATP-binding protein [Candidatus Eremiobacteraeota bacterium]